MADYTDKTKAKIFSQVAKVSLGTLGEVPVIEDSVTVNTGDIDKTEIKLIDGTIWTSKTSKGDSDISFQIPALDSVILEYFFEKQTDGSYKMTTSQKSNQSVAFYDSDSDYVTFTGCDVYGALVLGDGDNPGYINVTVTPGSLFTWTSKSSS